MADEHYGAGEGPAPNNVFHLDHYRARRMRCDRGTTNQEKPFEVQARLYIDVCSDGETRFGVVGADVDNAICMLEPMFVLGRQLVRLATE